MRNGRAVLLASALLAAITHGVATADQAAYISQDDAKRAAGLITEGMEIRHFCPPAGDKTWRVEIVEKLSVEPAGYENYYELKINGAGVDLAYVYVPERGRWANLALRTGLQVSEVPELLPVKGYGVDFNRNQYRGLIDGRLAIQMDLGKAGDSLSGSYAYDTKGIALVLEGTVDSEGAFTLTEFDEEKKTGLFTGKLNRKGEHLEGAWVSPDGAKRLPFTADKFAELTEEDISVTVKGWTIDGHLACPSFVAKDPAVAKRLNKDIHDALREGYKVFEEDTREILADLAPPGEGDDPSCYYDTSDYDVTFYSDAVVSMYFVVSSYAGGAHPNSLYRVFNYCVRPDGKLESLDLDDLFKPGAAYATKLSEFLIADLKKQEAEWVVNGQTKEFLPAELATFVVTPRGLRFLFSPYAVGPYVQGPFEVEVPYSVFGDTLDAAGPLKSVLASR